MSFKWPPKDPDEILDYSIDWSRYLDGKTISACTWYVDDADGVKTTIGNGVVVYGIQNVTSTISNGITTINLGLGTNNIDYKFTCSITDSNGNVTERVVRLKVKDQ